MELIAKIKKWLGQGCTLRENSEDNDMSLSRERYDRLTRIMGTFGKQSTENVPGLQKKMAVRALRHVAVDVPDDKLRDVFTGLRIFRNPESRYRDRSEMARFFDEEDNDADEYEGRVRYMIEAIMRAARMGYLTDARWPPVENDLQGLEEQRVVNQTD